MAELTFKIVHSPCDKASYFCWAEGRALQKNRRITSPEWLTSACDWVVCFLVLSCMSHLYILEINPFQCFILQSNSTGIYIDKYMGIKWKRGGGINWENGIDIYTLLGVK